MAKASGKKTKGAKGGAKWPRLTIALVITVALVILFPETVVIFVAGMTPTLVARIVDRAPQKYFTLTVGYMNISGCFMVALEMWISGDSSWEKAMGLLGDPVNWFIMFAAAGAGWGLHFSIPPVVASYMKVSAESRLKAVIERQQKLTKQWGTDVKDEAPDIPPELVADAEAVRRKDAQRAAQLAKGAKGSNKGEASNAAAKSKENEAPPREEEEGEAT